MRSLRELKAQNTQSTISLNELLNNHIPKWILALPEAERDQAIRKAQIAVEREGIRERSSSFPSPSSIFPC